MKRKTNIANTLEVIDHKAKYDAAVKRLLGDKTVLAWIIRDTIEEFKDYSIETIRDCIQGEPQTARKKVFPGYTPEMVTGNNTEDSVIGFLEILLSDRMTAEEKYELLEKTYGIVTSVDIKEVLGSMNSLSDYVEKRATERGMKKGLEMGMEKGMEMGMEKGVIIMARKFLSHSISEETIIADLEEVLGISYEEARGLFKQHSQ